MIPHNLPDYVERGGRQVWRPPYLAKQARIFGFVVPAGRAPIDALLHRDLVEPAGGAVDYRCAHESVLVSFAAIEELGSGDPTDSQRGYLPEFEVSIWCLVADAIDGGRLLWYLPYVFTDSGQTVATGREVYGYPKQIGYFPSSYPDALANGGPTVVEALAIDPFDPIQEAIRHPVISATRAPGTQGQGMIGGGAAGFAGLTGLFSAGAGVSAKLPYGPVPGPSATITATTAPPPPPKPGPPPWSVKRVLNVIQGRGLTGDPDELIMAMVANPTLVFLKQFRDVTCPTKACYQAVVEAPIAPTAGSYESLDPKMFELRIEDWDSHPIATDLGIAAATAITPEHAFEAILDFEIQLGLEVWRAPT